MITEQYINIDIGKQIKKRYNTDKINIIVFLIFLYINQMCTFYNLLSI